MELDSSYSEEQKRLLNADSRSQEDDFDNYMKKVQLVEDVLKKLSSSNPLVSQQGIKEADKLLEGNTVDVDEDDIRTKKSRTVVNQRAFDKFDEDEEEGPKTMHPNEFMRQVEEDAKQRAEDRRQRKMESDRHKTDGNKAFRDKKYAKALVCYDKAIDELKDSCILYCNRALTYLKLGLPEKALKDAEMSLRVNDKSLRGFVYKAQALWEMGEEKGSRETIDKACEVLPQQESYLREVSAEWQPGE